MRGFLIVFLVVAMSVLPTGDVEAGSKKKLKRALGVAIGLGVGAAIVNEIQKKQKKKKKNKAGATVAKVPGVALSRSDAKQVQVRLNVLGYNAGTPDGVLGANSRKAIRRFQSANGLKATGYLTAAGFAMLTTGSVGTQTQAASAQSGQTTGCGDPMSGDQLQDVINHLHYMQSIGKSSPTSRQHHVAKFSVDKCRNLTVDYDGTPLRGKLHQLFSELNSSHHDTGYFGLNVDGNYYVDNHGNMVYHDDSDPARMADWLYEIDKETVTLLRKAGYRSDPSAGLREKIIANNADTFQRPDFSDNMRALVSTIRKYGGSGSGGSSPAAPSGSASSGNDGNSSGGTATAQARGVSSIDRYGTGPQGQTQYKIKCHNGNSYRYYWHEGEWWGAFGVAGRSNWTIKQMAEDRCR